MATTTEEGLIKLDNLYQGSTFEGAELSLSELHDDGTESFINLTGAKVRIDMIKDNRIWSTYSSELQDNDPKKLIISESVFTFQQHIPTLPSGNYIFDIKVVFANETVETGIGRGQWSILNPLTK